MRDESPSTPTPGVPTSAGDALAVAFNQGGNLLDFVGVVV
jgi:hypothetical protein